MKSKSLVMHGHMRRTGIYSGLIAKELGLRPKQIQVMREAGYVHDIGKLLLPNSILEFKWRLSPDQRLIINKHTTYGAELLKPVGQTRLAATLRRLQPAIRDHHEHYDGTGDRGLKGARIPLAARIVAVADAFDAMTSDRGYNSPKTLKEGLQVLQHEAGKQFDPQVVSAFARALHKSLPRLSGPPSAAR